MGVFLALWHCGASACLDLCRSDASPPHWLQALKLKKKKS